ncbi:MAG: type III polyketide synthase [Candidatus Sumerlaeia bacterium]|nr:type III polyketide synthase [Candidatus Sumerlaeia bacterium]
MMKAVLGAGDRLVGLIDAAVEHSGVVERGVVLEQNPEGRWPFYEDSEASPSTEARMKVYQQFAPELAEKAARDALVDAGSNPTSITHLVTVSCTGFMAPGLDAELVQRLGLQKNVERVHVGFMGCHAGVNGLRVAQGLAQQSGGLVLLVCVELCSIHFQYGSGRHDLLPNVLFGDGAAALVVGLGEAGLRVRGTASFLLPNSESAMTWLIGNTGFRMTLSNQVPGLIEGALDGILQEQLACWGIQREQITGWVVHPGGPRILEAVETALGCGPKGLAASWKVLRSHGNMSSPTLFFVLSEILKQQKTGYWVGMAFGPGVTIELVLFYLGKRS